MEKFRSTQKTLHLHLLLVLVLAGNHGGNGIFAGLGETLRVRSDFVTKKRDDISANPRFFYLEYKTVCHAVLKDNTKFGCGIDITVG